MKKKLEKFNEESELRDMYYKRDLNRAANESEKQEIYEKGLAEGEIKGFAKGTSLFKFFIYNFFKNYLFNLF